MDNVEKEGDVKHEWHKRVAAVILLIGLLIFGLSGCEKTGTVYDSIYENEDKIEALEARVKALEPESVAPTPTSECMTAQDTVNLLWEPFMWSDGYGGHEYCVIRKCDAYEEVDIYRCRALDTAQEPPLTVDQER